MPLRGKAGGEESGQGGENDKSEEPPIPAGIERVTRRQKKQILDLKSAGKYIPVEQKHHRQEQCVKNRVKGHRSAF